MAKAEARANKSSKPDLATVGGILLAFGAVVGGLLLEGGEIHDIAQCTAAVIVLGGTIGAVMLSTPWAVFLGAGARLISSVFLVQAQPTEKLVEDLLSYATRARKNGIVSLEQEAARIEDPFLRKALNLAVDGTDPQELRRMMELEIALEEHHVEAEAKVFEAAGGFAPTVGILGAVMGLIQVMKNLSDIDKVGHGIAVAFVATVYGVAVANLFFLPAAAKIKARAHQEAQRKEMAIEGVIGIVEGLNPKLVQLKLESYSHSSGKKKSGKAAAKDQQAAAQAARATG